MLREVYVVTNVMKLDKEIYIRGIGIGPKGFIFIQVELRGSKFKFIKQLRLPQPSVSIKFLFELSNLGQLLADFTVSTVVAILRGYVWPLFFCPLVVFVR